MDVRQTNSITGVGSPAAATVATSLAPRSAATSKTTGAASTTSTASAAANSSDITSSDFLTLLVSELKNQDPTQPADPNAYISQLVGVNSLEQLIQINSGLTTIETPTTTSTSPTAGALSGMNSGASANAVAATNSVSGTQMGANPNSIWGGATSS